MSDKSTATIGFFGGAIVVALILLGVSLMTTSNFHKKHGAAPAAEHRGP
jgi:hypothetical protein